MAPYIDKGINPVAKWAYLKQVYIVLIPKDWLNFQIWTKPVERQQVSTYLKVFFWKNTQCSSNSFQIRCRSKRYYYFRPKSFDMVENFECEKSWHESIAQLPSSSWNSIFRRQPTWLYNWFWWNGSQDGRQSRKSKEAIDNQNCNQHTPYMPWNS